MTLTLVSKFNLHGYTTTEINTRLVRIDFKAKYKCQNVTHSTHTFTPPCMFELPPQAMVSPALCQCYVWDKLVAMRIDPYYCDFFAPTIASYAIAAPSHVGDGAGFFFRADLRIIIDVDHYLIPMEGGDSFIRHDIDERILMHDGVIVLNGAEEDMGHMATVVPARPRGASKSLIDKLIRKGRLAADNDDVKGTCPVCLEDFLPRRTTTELLRMPCSHLFHHHCIVPWLEPNDSCPMCRKVVAA